MQRTLFILLCWVAVNVSASPSASFRYCSIDSLYQTLDSLVAHRQIFVERKQQQIAMVRAELNREGLTALDSFQLNQRLYDEYMAFEFDSAFSYIRKNIRMMERRGDTDRLCQSKLRLAHILSVTGIFDKASLLLDHVAQFPMDVDNRILYYRERNDLALFQSEFAINTDYFQGYQDTARYYRQLLIDTAPSDRMEHVFAKATFVCEEGRYDEAIRLLETLLPQYKEGTRTFSVLTSTLAYFYSRKSDTQMEERYQLLSAISDMRGAIRESTALRKVAMTLFSRGDLNRAFEYLNTSISDAVAYGTRLRNFQAAELVPDVVLTYRNMQVRQRMYERCVLIAALAFIALLLGLVWYIMRLLKKQKAANQKIKDMNVQLNQSIADLHRSMEEKDELNRQMRESNAVKDQYIGHFMEMGSDLIGIAEEQSKLENRLARDKRTAELYEQLKGRKFLAESTRLFYSNFDAAFLNIYPTFVDEVNNLLEPENRLEPKEERLTTDLRILALIRLGITENQKISSILRAPITTVYTYRSKMKGKAKDKDNFEESVKRIQAYL